MPQKLIPNHRTINSKQLLGKLRKRNWKIDEELFLKNSFELWIPQTANTYPWKMNIYCICVWIYLHPPTDIYFIGECSTTAFSTRPHWLITDIHIKKLFWISPKSFSHLDVSAFECALGDFFVLSASVLCQIARYLPHHTSGNTSKTHPKSAHDKFKTVSKVFAKIQFFPFAEQGCLFKIGPKWKRIALLQQICGKECLLGNEFRILPNKELKGFISGS